MAFFTCRLKIDIPSEVRVGIPATATVVVEETSAPIKSVVCSIDAYGIRQSLKRVDATTFRMSLTVPAIAPRGNYKISVWAVSEDGRKSEPSTHLVTLR